MQTDIGIHSERSEACPRVARVYGQLWTGVWTKKSIPSTTHHSPIQQKIHAVAPYFPQIFDIFLNFLIDIFLHLHKLQPDFLVYHFNFFWVPWSTPTKKKTLKFWHFFAQISIASIFLWSHI